MDIKKIEKEICQEIKKAEKDLRAKYDILKHQDLLGALIFLGSLAAIALMWSVYFNNRGNVIVTVAAVLSITFLTSLLHELEHDIIHNLYFRQSIIQDVMFLFIWLAKVHSNPWFRRELHLKHHIISGQVDDAEERLIGLGLPWSWRRLVATVHPFGVLLLSSEVAKDATWLDVQRMNLTSAPVAFIFFGLNKALLAYLIAFFMFGESAGPLPLVYWPWVRDLNILICLPNILRSFSIIALSTCSHYYGDIPGKSVFFQNQILDHWILYPFQIFAFNFGATHIVHHYVPGQPFYLRQLVFWRVKDFMVSKGVRLNDFSIVERSNRYFDHPNTISSTPSSVAIDTEDVKLSPALMHTQWGVSMWLVACTSVGMATFFLLDQIVTLSLAGRIVRKYLLKKD